MKKMFLMAECGHVVHYHDLYARLAQAAGGDQDITCCYSCWRAGEIGDSEFRTVAELGGHPAHVHGANRPGIWL